MADATCQVCSKGQAELPQPLKRRAKCLTGSYCSRDCQKADWKDHQKSCSAQGSLHTAQAPNLDSEGPFPTQNHLDVSGEIIDATYSTGCYDQHGNPLGDELPVGLRRNRSFDPVVDSRYTMPWLAPYQLIRTHNLDHMAFLMRTTPSGGRVAEPDTIVMEVGARKLNGLTVAARSFGPNSEYNAIGVPEARTTHNAISRTTCLGCQNAIQFFQNGGGNSTQGWAFLKRVVIMTSSKVIAHGVNKLFDWFKDGFPSTLPGGMTKEDWILLHANIKALEDKGIAVRFWKVKPEYILHTTMMAWDKFIELGLAPAEDPDVCRCPGCVQKKQLRELEYAQTGILRGPSGVHSASLISKSLKRGDKFAITNTAGITEPTLTMQVDGGSTYRNPDPSDT